MVKDFAMLDFWDLEMHVEKQGRINLYKKIKSCIMSGRPFLFL